jgi:hypothetical protein
VVSVSPHFFLVLSDQFFDKNIFNVAGGIELAFMSTTTDKNVAMKYMGGKTGAIFEIQMGMIDKGADLSQLSQYPGESEVLFTPLTGEQQLNTFAPCILHASADRC